MSYQRHSLKVKKKAFCFSKIVSRSRLNSMNYDLTVIFFSKSLILEVKRSFGKYLVKVENFRILVALISEFSLLKQVSCQTLEIENSLTI